MATETRGWLTFSHYPGRRSPSRCGPACWSTESSDPNYARSDIGSSPLGIEGGRDRVCRPGRISHAGAGEDLPGALIRVSGLFIRSLRQPVGAEVSSRTCYTHVD